MDQIKTGKFIAQLRRERNLTQEELGQRLGVTNKTVSRWETGSYMPGIETLQLLSEEFQVSINELLTGERLSKEDFPQKAEENIIDMMKNSSFDIKERMTFWKRKWLKEHRFQIVLCVLGCAVVFLALIRWDWGGGAAALVSIAAYAYLHNQMMIYIESHVFEPPDK